MLNREELRSIAKVKGDGHFFVSCYLSVDPVSNVRGDYIIHIKNMLKKTMEDLDRDVRKKVKPDIEKIDAYVFANKKNFKKGLALISSTGADFWKEFHLSVGLKNEIIVDKLPYIKPLLDIIDRYQKYAVMIIDKENARLFAIQLGEIEEYREVYTENVPGKHKKGGWFSLEQKSIERHTDYHVGLHIKDVIKQLEDMLTSGDIGRLILGGSEEALSLARSQFTKKLSDKIIGTFTVSMNANVNEVVSKAQSVLEQYENKGKEQFVDELMTKTMKKENAVLGIDNVLSALQEGRVMKLLYIRDYKDSGYSCNKCGFLTTQKTELCPYCKIGMQRIDYIVDLAAQKAIEQGSSVEVIGNNPKLFNAGSIGALLRY